MKTFESKLRITRTAKLNENAFNDIYRTAVVHNQEQIITYDNKKFYQVTFTSYNMLPYEKIVEGLIKDKYSIEEELCLTNKRINDPLNIEYFEYRKYVEDCKTKARAFIEERKNAIGK